MYQENVELEANSKQPENRHCISDPQFSRGPSMWLVTKHLWLNEVCPSLFFQLFIDSMKSWERTGVEGGKHSILLDNK